MKKKLKSIITGALCAVMLLPLVACGGGGGGTTDKSSLSPKSGEPIYLSDMLEAGGRRIWYRLHKGSIGKDAKIRQVIVFENGEVTTYFLDYLPELPPDGSIHELYDVEFRTLGDVSKLTDDEIVETLKQALMQAYAQDDQKPEADNEIMPERPEPSSYAYELNVKTDSTGNNTASEKINYTFDIYLTPENDEFYYPKTHSIHLGKSYTEGAVYDAFFGGFFNVDSDWLFVTRLPETLTGKQGSPKLDTPDRPGVTVD